MQYPRGQHGPFVTALHDDLPAAREIEMRDPFHAMGQRGRRRGSGGHGNSISEGGRWKAEG